MKHTLAVATLRVLIGTAAFAAKFKDDFTQPKLEQRRAARGGWKFADSIARCTQNDALYKKNKDHGPIEVKP